MQIANDKVTDKIAPLLIVKTCCFVISFKKLNWFDRTSRFKQSLPYVKSCCAFA